MVQDGAIVTMADQWKVVHGLSNRAILNDLERPQTNIWRSGHSLMLNICEMAKDTTIVTMIGEYKPYPSFQMVPFLVTLTDL